jgi:hypothetical protein
MARAQGCQCSASDGKYSLTTIGWALIQLWQIPKPQRLARARIHSRNGESAYIFQSTLSIHVGIKEDDMALPTGPWLSHIGRTLLPNDGLIIINDPDPDNNDFDGDHYRPDKTPIRGHFTPAAPGTLAHITFTETVNTVTYKYDADIVPVTTNFSVTTGGKRTPVSPAGATTEDWVGTHTT